MSSLVQASVGAPHTNSFAKSHIPTKPGFNTRSSQLQMSINSNSLQGAINQTKNLPRGSSSIAKFPRAFSKYSALPSQTRATKLAAKKDGEQEFTVN